ncbi:MAG: glycosyltransferase 87 family protein [archaeon]
MATGYAVAHGQSPYVLLNVSQVFGSSAFPDPVPGIGYPPPWGFILAAAYLVSYDLFPSLLAYNLAVKVPVVIGNILLALLVGKMVRSQTSDASLSRSATNLMLFNPFVIYTTSVWGQFDTLVTLLMLLALFWSAQGKSLFSAAALGTSISLKLLPAVLLPLMALYEGKRRGWPRALLYSVCVLAVVAISLAPFQLRWSLSPIMNNWSIHFEHVGAFSPMNVLVPPGVNDFPNGLHFLGYLWLPLMIAMYCLLSRRRIDKLQDLVPSSLILMLVLSLSRAWVSEQNLNLVLPLVLLGTTSERWSRKWFAITWLLPLVFALLNSSPLLMFSLIVPEQTLKTISPHTYGPEIVHYGRILVTTAWLTIGATLVKKSMDALSDPQRATFVRSQAFPLSAFAARKQSA